MKIPDLRRLLAAYLDLEHWETDGLIARLTPVVVLDDISPESGADKAGPRWAMGQSDITAVAAQYAISHLQNPTGSGILCEVFDIWYGDDASGLVYLGFHEVEAAGSSPEKLINRYYESGAGVPSDPTCRLTEETNAATGVQAGEVLYRQRMLGNSVQHIALNGSLVLKPGTGVRLLNGTVEKSLWVSWRWRETPEKT